MSGELFWKILLEIEELLKWYTVIPQGRRHILKDSEAYNI